MSEGHPDKRDVSDDPPVVRWAITGTAINARHAATAHLRAYPPGGEPFSATGSSKRQPGDPYDKHVGVQLAMARALKAAGEEMERRAMGKVAELAWKPGPWAWMMGLQHGEYVPVEVVFATSKHWGHVMTDPVTDPDLDLLAEHDFIAETRG